MVERVFQQPANNRARRVIVQFALNLPTFAGGDFTIEDAARIKDVARRADELGFDALWVADHIMVAPGLYGTTYLTALLCLAHCASVTTKIRLGAGILVLPYYHPVSLAHEIQSLQYLSAGRFVLGIGSGWAEHEFEALGMHLNERGRRTDEVLSALRPLLTERNVSFEGRYYSFQDATVEPILSEFPELWVAGGSRTQTELSPDRASIAPAVLRRIADADGWLARSAGNQEMVKSDLKTIRAYLQSHGRDPDSLRYGHVNFAYVVDTDDHEEALRIQRPRFERVMGTHRSFEHLQQSYMMGTTQEIVDRIADLERSGIEYLVLAMLDHDLDQLERLSSEIVSRFQKAS